MRTLRTSILGVLLLFVVLFSAALAPRPASAAPAHPSHPVNNCGITYWHLQHESGWSAWTNPDGRQNVISVRADAKLWVELSYYDGSFCNYWQTEAVFYINTNGGSANCSYNVRSQLHIPISSYFNNDTSTPSNACNQNWHVWSPTGWASACYTNVDGTAEYLDFGDNAYTSGTQC